MASLRNQRIPFNWLSVSAMRGPLTGLFIGEQSVPGIAAGGMEATFCPVLRSALFTLAESSEPSPQGGVNRQTTA